MVHDEFGYVWVEIGCIINFHGILISFQSISIQKYHIANSDSRRGKPTLFFAVCCERVFVFQPFSFTYSHSICNIPTNSIDKQRKPPQNTRLTRTCILFTYLFEKWLQNLIGYSNEIFSLPTFFAAKNDNYRNERKEISNIEDTSNYNIKYRDIANPCMHTLCISDDLRLNKSYL